MRTHSPRSILLLRQFLREARNNKPRQRSELECLRIGRNALIYFDGEVAE